jgi:hypothetical protein
VEVNTLEDYSSLRQQILEAQELKKQPDGTYTCLLNTEFHDQDFYQFPYGFLVIEKKKVGPETYCIEAIVSSIDDVSVPMFGPGETSEKAEKRLLSIVESIKEWEGWLPQIKDLRPFCNKLGLYLNI